MWHLFGIRISPLLAALSGIAIGAVGIVEGRVPVIVVGGVVVVIGVVRAVAAR
jgi:hypothetical protein